VFVRSIAETLGMKLVFFNCGAVIEASDFFATIQVRASESGAPVTDFVKTEVLEAIEDAREHPEERYLVFLDELNRCPESARNALMPMLDSFRRVYHPIEARFVAIPDNVQFVAAVNRGSAFSATFGLDAAQLDRFAPLQVDYLPADEEVKLLRRRHPDLGRPTIERLVSVAAAIRDSPELQRGLSVRATEEACIYLSHPLMSSSGGDAVLQEVLRSSFCGRFDGRWDDSASEAGAAWRSRRGCCERHRIEQTPSADGMLRVDGGDGPADQPSGALSRDAPRGHRQPPAVRDEGVDHAVGHRWAGPPRHRRAVARARGGHRPRAAPRGGLDPRRLERRHLPRGL
jgi:hypothetical protein